MQDPQTSLRAPEIFSLYVMLLIAQDTGVPFKQKYMEANYESNNDLLEENELIEYESEKLAKEEIEKESNEYILDHIRKLYLDYYEKIKSILSKDYKKSNLDLDDKRWDILLRILGK